MIGQVGFISLTCFATSQPFRWPFKLTSVTSALYSLILPLNKVSASSPEDRISASNPPSMSASSTTPCNAYSSSTTRIKGNSDTSTPAQNSIGRGEKRTSKSLVPLEMFKSEHWAEPAFLFGRLQRPYDAGNRG